MKTYNYSLATELIEMYKNEGLLAVNMGIKEDWEWTFDTVWRDGTYEVDIQHGAEIEGIHGSNWGTPIIVMIFEDGNVISLFCFVDDGEEPYMTPLNKFMYYGTKDLPKKYKFE